MSAPVPFSQTFGTALQGEVAIAAQKVISALTEKQAARVATTANVTIATALNVGDTIDGITLAAGDRVLVKDQTTQSQNGIYEAAASPVRTGDFDASEEILGALVPVVAGTVNAGKLFKNTNTAPITVDTDAITFEEQEGRVGSLGDIEDVDADAPAEDDVLIFDGTNWIAVSSGRHAHVVGEPFVGDGAQTVFYLANEAEPDTVAAYVAGARTTVTQDATELDKITFAAAPAAGTHVFDYIPATG